MYSALVGLTGQAELYVETSPGPIVDESPTMARPRCVGTQQYLTWTRHKRLPVASREFERARQSDHILYVWCGILIEG